MNWDRLKTKLEQILNVPMRVEKMPESDWNSYVFDSPGGDSSAVTSVDQGDSILFYLSRDGAAVYALAVEHSLLTASERQLIELSIEGFRTVERKKPVYPRSEEESRALALREWIQQQLDAGLEHKEIPDSFASYSSLYSTKVPILLNGDYSDDRKVNYLDLKKLLESFFDAEIILVPLQDKEWLILGSESLLAESGAGEKGDVEETVEEALGSICSGLHEMLESEWVGECHMAISYPIVPAKSMLASVVQLRETISLGRTYHVGKNIHLPWEMHLDRLMNRISVSEKAAFIDHIFKQKEHLLDAEMLQTLDHFFDLDCNVSDTAKKLYIHRNTLLYRLDKFKQETGLDVRSFNDAVLVKLALLLYKVTKRK